MIDVRPRLSQSAIQKLDALLAFHKRNSYANMLEVLIDEAYKKMLKAQSKNNTPPAP